MEVHEQPKLKDCPFCGGKAKMYYHGRNGFKIKCTKCTVSYVQKVLRFTTDWLFEKMVSQWNTRQNDINKE